MNYKMMGRFIAQILAIEWVFMIPALILSLVFGESGATYGFLLTLGAILAALVIGTLLDYFVFGQSGVCTYILGGIGLLLYIYAIVLTVMTLKTEKKAQERAYSILKSNRMATDEELADLKELFHLYNIQYINDIILACLEMLYTILQIALAVKKGEIKTD